MPRMPFITPGTSKNTIYNALTTKKIIQQNSFLNQALGGTVVDDVNANHTGQIPVMSASTNEGTIRDSPKNKVRIFQSATKDIVKYDPGTGAREVFGRLTGTGGYSENFDALPLGPPPSPWLPNASTGSIVDVTNLQAHSAPNSLRLQTANIYAATAVAYAPKIIMTGDVINWWFRGFVDGTNWGIMRIRNALTSPIEVHASLEILFGMLYYRAGFGTFSSGIAVTGGWQSAQIIMNYTTNTYRLKVDGVPVLHLGSPDIPFTPSSLGYGEVFAFEIVCVGPGPSPIGVGNVLYIDDISWTNDWLLSYYYMSDLGVETPYYLPVGTYDYWYPVRTNLRDMVEDFSLDDRELLVDSDNIPTLSWYDHLLETSPYYFSTGAMNYGKRWKYVSAGFAGHFTGGFKPTSSTGRWTTSDSITDPFDWGWDAYDEYNPSEFSYLQFAVKLNSNYSTDGSGAATIKIGFQDTLGAGHYAYFSKGTNAGTLKAESSDGGAVESTDNIACDLTAYPVIGVKIKSTGAYFYINGVLVASHTTNYPYVYTPGLKIFGNFNGTLSHDDLYYELDYFRVLVGEAF